MGNTAYIRSDGSKEIGMGHLYRAILISGMLETRFGLKPQILMKENEQAVAFMATTGARYLTFPAASIEEEIQFLKEHSLKDAPACLVADVPAVENDPVYMGSLRQVGCPTIAISDESIWHPIDADIILNGHPHQNNKQYGEEKGIYLTGSKYFLMDPAYMKSNVAAPTGKIRRILLAFGRTDHLGLVFNVLDALKPLNMLISVLVISSQATGYLDRLKQSLKGMPFASRLVVDPVSLYPYWEECDVAIISGGNMVFERIASRVPGATICALESQLEIAHYFAIKDVNFNLGFAPKLAREELPKRLRAFFDNAENHRKQYENAPLYVRGRGLQYLGDEIQKLFAASGRIISPT